MYILLAAESNTVAFKFRLSGKRNRTDGNPGYTKAIGKRR